MEDGAPLMRLAQAMRILSIMRCWDISSCNKNSTLLQKLDGTSCLLATLPLTRASLLILATKLSFSPTLTTMWSKIPATTWTFYGSLRRTWVTLPKFWLTCSTTKVLPPTASNKTLCTLRTTPSTTMWNRQSTTRQTCLLPLLMHSSRWRIRLQEFPTWYSQWAKIASMRMLNSTFWIWKWC